MLFTIKSIYYLLLYLFKILFNTLNLQVFVLSLEKIYHTELFLSPIWEIKSKKKNGKYLAIKELITILPF